MRVLVADDEQDLNKLITKKLMKEGYFVDSCYDGQDAVEYISSADYDAIILDVMMPKMDGFEVLRKIRADGIKSPVLFLTARDSVADKVKGLDCGANDYLVKPFSFDELLARLRVLTRAHTENATNLYTVADLTLDSQTHIVTRGGKTIDIPAKEFALLEYMIMNKNVVLSRERIENHIWNADYYGGTNLVDVYISNLRKKIDGGSDVRLIHTIRGFGYVIREEQ